MFRKHTYTDFIYEQIKDLKIGESKSVVYRTLDKKNRPKTVYYSTVSRIGSLTGKLYRNHFNFSNGDMIVTRVE